MSIAIDRGRGAEASNAREGAGPAALAHANRRARLALLGLWLLLAALAVASCAVGRFPVPPRAVLAILLDKLWPSPLGLSREAEAVVLAIRAPRILAAILVGGALSMAGAAYQGLFRNPMVSPSILGVSSGAGLGAALAIRWDLGRAGIQGSAFAFGLGAVAITWLVGALLDRRVANPVLVLVLAGSMMGMLFSALISAVKLLADPVNTLPAITYWLMGSLASVTAADISAAALPIAAGGGALLLLSWRLNVLSMGDEEARALGLSTGALRLAVALAATLMTAAAVAISGVVGLIGLFVPHLARMLAGAEHRRLLPVAAVLGACFLLAADDLARSLFAVEIPLGIVTAVVGAPLFLFLLSRGRAGWE